MVLVYNPRSDWVDECVANDTAIPVKRDYHSNALFTFAKDDILVKMPIKDVLHEEFGDNTEHHIWHFKLGELTEDGYYNIPARILLSHHDVYIHKAVQIKEILFASKVFNTRIVPIIDRMINAPLIIGGDRDCAIPECEYIAMISRLPTNDELHLYAQSRIEGVLNEYYPQTQESSSRLSDYIKRRYKRSDAIYNQLHSLGNPNDAIADIQEMDCAKMQFAVDRMDELLAVADKYVEKQWQKEIEKIIFLAFPQYVAKVSPLKIPDSIGDAKYREIDIALVSMSGNVDIVEIKRPEEWQLLSHRPNHRDNYIPSRKLSCAVMQAEKYLANLKRWGHRGEDKISKRLGFPGVVIRQPRAMLIMGRDAELDCTQKRSDFEIIKREFSHMLDIVTYDDLISRLKNAVKQFKTAQ